ncbi:MAG: hypothetical protein ACOX1N_04835 [Candidatus Methanomethylophilaceae archaeon]|jgi:hypothetical protein
MTIINIEYRHSSEPPGSEELRRRSNREMTEYLAGLVADMMISDIPARLTETETEGKNTVLINGENVHDILNGLEIRMLDSEDSCNLNRPNLIKFERPVLDWKKEYIEDIPDVLMKNAISKIYADCYKNRIM